MYPPIDPKYVLTQNVSWSDLAPPFTETLTIYCPVLSAVKLEYCLVVLSRTALEPVGLETNDHVNEVTVVAPEPVVSANRYAFAPLPNTFRPCRRHVGALAYSRQFSRRHRYDCQLHCLRHRFHRHKGDEATDSRVLLEMLANLFIVFSTVSMF